VVDENENGAFLNLYRHGGEEMKVLRRGGIKKKIPEVLNSTSIVHRPHHHEFFLSFVTPRFYNFSVFTSILELIMVRYELISSFNIIIPFTHASFTYQGLKLLFLMSIGLPQSGSNHER
jgi:hypothetical protein